MRFESVAQTHKGLVRETNQDSMLALKERGVFAVADGMGGEQAGDEASAQVVLSVKTAAEAFFKTPPEGPGQIEGMLRDTLLQANHEVLQIAVREPAKRGLGSTVSLLCVHRGVYFVAQVGDSRVYLARGSQVRQLTRDHTLVWELYEQGVIPRGQIDSHPERHLLTQCVGSLRPIRIDLIQGEIQPGDTFLICSDGLNGYAAEERIFSLLTDPKLPLETCAKRLIDEALKSGGGDNVSVVLTRIRALDAHDDWSPQAGAAPPPLDPSLDVTVMDERLRPAARPEPRRKRLPWVMVASLALAILILAVPLFLPPSQARVYLQQTGGNLPGPLEISTSLGKQPIMIHALERDARGLFFCLPGVGPYDLLLAIPGYVPQHHTLMVPPGHNRLVLTPAPWMRMAQLGSSTPAPR